MEIKDRLEQITKQLDNVEVEKLADTDKDIQFKTSLKRPDGLEPTNLPVPLRGIALEQHGFDFERLLVALYSNMSGMSKALELVYGDSYKELPQDKKRSIMGAFGRDSLVEYYNNQTTEMVMEDEDLDIIALGKQALRRMVVEMNDDDRFEVMKLVGMEPAELAKWAKKNTRLAKFIQDPICKTNVETGQSFIANFTFNKGGAAARNVMDKVMEYLNYTAQVQANAKQKINVRKAVPVLYSTEGVEVDETKKIGNTTDDSGMKKNKHGIPL